MNGWITEYRLAVNDITKFMADVRVKGDTESGGIRCDEFLRHAGGSLAMLGHGHQSVIGRIPQHVTATRRDVADAQYLDLCE